VTNDDLSARLQRVYAALDGHLGNRHKQGSTNCSLGCEKHSYLPGLPG